MDNTRAVRQTQASIDEEAEEGELDESGENFGEEDPSEGGEDEGNDGEEEDEEEEDDADSGSDDDDDNEGSGASGDEDSLGGHNVVEEEANEPRNTKNHLVDPMRMVEMQERVQTLRWIAGSKYEGQKGGAVVGSRFSEPYQC